MKYLSASQISLYSSCSRCYFFRYIKQIYKVTTSPHLIYGSAIHKALEKLSLSLTTIPMTREELIHIFTETWNKEISIIETKKGQYDNLRVMGIKSLQLYFNKFINYEPIIYKDNDQNKLAVECKFSVPIIYPNGVEDKDYQLHGVMDLIAKKQDKIFIYDHKTSKDPYDSFQVNTSIQLVLYSYAFRWMIKEGLFPDVKESEEAVVFNVILKDYKRAIPKIIPYARQVTEEDINNVLNIIEITLRGINNRIFLPNFTKDCKWCDYQKECLEFKNESVEAAQWETK